MNKHKAMNHHPPRNGWIRPVVLESGRWRFREEDVERLAGIVKPKRVVLYVRVSSNTQRDDQRDRSNRWKSVLGASLLLRSGRGVSYSLVIISVNLVLN